MSRLSLTSKLVHHVSTPFMEVATATMTNQDAAFRGATFTGFVNNERTGVRAAYAGIFDVLVPQPSGDASSHGALAGTLRPRPANPETTAASATLTRAVAKNVEYQISTHSSQGNRFAWKPSDLMTHGLTADANLTSTKQLRDASRAAGCRGTWFVARDLRDDDLLDVELQRNLEATREAVKSVRVPDIRQDVLPRLSSRYSDDENASEARERLMRGARSLDELEVELHVANVGDGRAFGLLRRGARRGGREESDPEYKRESFELRHARDLATELPGWHGKESTDAFPREHREKLDRAAKKEAPKPQSDRQETGATTPSSDQDAHEPLEALGFRGDDYLPPAGKLGAGPIDPCYEENAHMSFHTQELALRDRRKRLLPLSVDMRPTRLEERVRVRNAGGAIDILKHVMSTQKAPLNEKGLLPPQYDAPNALGASELCIPVSRAFGFHELKENPHLSAFEQQVSPAPDVQSWVMHAGDLFIMSSHALYETRSGEPTSIDSVCDVVLEAVARRGVATGASGEEADGLVSDIARDLCDFAVRFGAPRNIAVTVARVREPVRRDALGGLESDAHAAAAVADRLTNFTKKTERVIGAIYPGALRGVPRYREMVTNDASRMGLTLVDVLARRYVEVAPLLRDLGIVACTAGLRKYARRYPVEGGHLAAVMADEADFFRDCPFAPEEIDPAHLTPAQAGYFQHLERFLVNPSGV
jgi:serine/threonine protein phosphatase PrpC